MQTSKRMIAVVTMIAALCVGQAQAQTVWTNNGSGLWGTPANWVGGVAPSLAGGSATYTIVLTNGSSASARTNSIGNPDFLLNQLALSDAAAGVALYGGSGTNLVFTNNATVMPQVVQGTGQSLTINHGITLATNLTFAGTGAGAVMVNSNITGSAGLIMSMSSVLSTATLSGANTFIGDVTVNSGRLILKNQANLYSNGFIRTLSVASGAFLQLGAPMNIGGTNSPGITLAGNGTLEVNPGSAKTVALGVTTANYSKLAMSGGLIDVQSGIFKNGPNQGQDWKDNKASLNINAVAECQPWDGSSMYIDALTGNGALGGSQSSSGSSSRPVIMGVNNGSGTFSGTITLKSTQIIKTGTGTQTFTGANVYFSPTTISNGFIAVGNNQALGTNVVNLSGGGLAAASGSWAITNVVNMKNNATFDTDVNSLTMVGPITNGGSLTKVGAGTLTLSGVNTYTGGTTNNAGVLQLGVAAGLPDGGALTVTGGAVDMQAFPAVIGTLSGSGGSITNNSSLTVTQGVTAAYSGVIAGSGALTKAGAGTLTLSGANTYTGGTTNSAGVLQMGVAAGLPDGGALTVMGGAVDMQAYPAVIGTLSGVGGSITNNSSLTVTQGSTEAYSGVIAGSGALTKAGTGTLTLSGANTFTGNINVNSGRLILNNQANLYSNGVARTLSVNSGAFLQFNGTMGIGGTSTPGIILAGNGTLEIVGGTVELGKNSANHVALAMTGGMIDVQAGVLRNGPNQGQDWKDNKASLSINAGAECQPWDGNNMYIDELDGSGTLGGSQSIPGTGKFLTLGVNNGSGIFSGTITNMTRAIIKTGTGTQTLTGTNSYAGVTTISNGFIAVGNNQALSTNVVNLHGGGLAADSGSWAITNVVNMKNPATFDTGVNSLTMVGSITGSGSLNKTGTGTLTLSGANTYTGGTTNSSGLLRLGVAAGLPGGGALTVMGGAVDMGAYSVAIGSLSGSGGSITNNGSLTVTQGVTAAYGGVVAGSGALTKAGTGTLTLSGVSLYAGNTTINAGTLALSGPGTLLDSANIIVDSGAILDVSAVTYTLGSGQTLKGVGTVKGAPVLRGTVSPGTVAGPATLAFTTGNPDFPNGGTFIWEVTQVDATTDDQGSRKGSWYDTLDMSAVTPTISATSAGSKYTIVVTASGMVTGWNPNKSYTWVLVSGLSMPSVDPAAFNVNSSSFEASNNRGNGSFAVTNSGNNLVLTFTPSASPVTVYWDANTTTTGAGTTPNGTWDTSAAPYWNFNSVGTEMPVEWKNGDNAVFSAGSDATGASSVTIGAGGVTVGDITVEEGVPTVTGGTLTIGNSSTITVAAAPAAMTISAVVSGSGDLTKAGAGDLTLSGANTFASNITVNSGRLILSNQGNLCSNGFVRTLSVASNAFLQFNADMIIGGTNAPGIILNGKGTIEIKAPTTGATINLGNIINRVKIAMDPGSLIDIQKGILQNGGYALQDWTNNYASLNISNGAQCYPWNGAPMRIDALTGSGALGGNQGITSTTTPLILGVNNGSGTFSGTITNMSNPIIKTGAGTQTFTGSNSYAGATTISNGFIAVGNNQALSTNVVNLYGGGLKAASGSWAITNVVNMKTNATFDTDVNSLTLVGSITNSGALTKIGSGTLTLSGANTYLGSTTVNGGTLKLSVTNALPSGTDVSITSVSAMDLSYAGTGTVHTLLIDGVPQCRGTWGSTGSGARHTHAVFQKPGTGNGILRVQEGPDSGSVYLIR